MYPDAADTVEGISAWWMRQSGKNISTQDVIAVVTDLCSKRFLNGKALDPHRVVYSLNKTKSDEIKKMLIANNE